MLPYLKDVEISSLGKRGLAAHLGLIQGSSMQEGAAGVTFCHIEAIGI